MRLDLEQGRENLVYLDNAATVFPKPASVLRATVDAYERFGVNPGRSGYDLCFALGELVDETRARMARFFGADADDPAVSERLCFGLNGSDALNTLILGLARPGDHVVTTNLEHNSVLRPLYHLEREGIIALSIVSCGPEGFVEPDELARAFRPNTRMAVVNHGSNVIGTIQPLAEIGRLCRERGVLLVVDTAQTAGVVPVDVEAMHIDALAFTGHKSLLAPSGIGGLWVRPGVEVRATRYGGTGVRSAARFHLDEYPFHLEVGTPNVLGIVGLALAQDWIAERGLAAIHEQEMRVFRRLLEGLRELERVEVYGPTTLEERLPVLSVGVEGLDPSDVGTMLDVDHAIATRTGLQCAPLVHEWLGTAPRGTVRLSVGPLNELEHAERAIEAFAEIAATVDKRALR